VARFGAPKHDKRRQPDAAGMVSPQARCVRHSRGRAHVRIVRHSGEFGVRTITLAASGSMVRHSHRLPPSTYAGGCSQGLLLRQWQDRIASRLMRRWDLKSRVLVDGCDIVVASLQSIVSLRGYVEQLAGFGSPSSSTKLTMSRPATSAPSSAHQLPTYARRRQTARTVSHVFQWFLAPSSGGRPTGRSVPVPCMSTS
jgi:hypothetical protein